MNRRAKRQLTAASADATPEVLAYAGPTKRGNATLNTGWRRLAAAMAGVAWALVMVDIAVFLLTSFPGTQTQKMVIVALPCVAVVACGVGTAAAIISLKNRRGGWLWLFLNAALLLVLLSLIFALILEAIGDHPHALVLVGANVTQRHEAITQLR